MLVLLSGAFGVVVFARTSSPTIPSSCSGDSGSCISEEAGAIRTRTYGAALLQLGGKIGKIGAELHTDDEEIVKPGEFANLLRDVVHGGLPTMGGPPLGGPPIGMPQNALMDTPAGGGSGGSGLPTASSGFGGPGPASGGPVGDGVGAPGSGGAAPGSGGTAPGSSGLPGNDGRPSSDVQGSGGASGNDGVGAQGNNGGNPTTPCPGHGAAASGGAPGTVGGSTSGNSGSGIGPFFAQKPSIQEARGEKPKGEFDFTSSKDDGLNVSNDDDLNISNNGDNFHIPMGDESETAHRHGHHAKKKASHVNTDAKTEAKTKKASTNVSQQEDFNFENSTDQKGERNNSDFGKAASIAGSASGAIADLKRQVQEIADKVSGLLKETESKEQAAAVTLDRAASGDHVSTHDMANASKLLHEAKDEVKETQTQIKTLEKTVSDGASSLPKSSVHHGGGPRSWLVAVIYFWWCSMRLHS